MSIERLYSAVRRVGSGGHNRSVDVTTQAPRVGEVWHLDRLEVQGSGQCSVYRGIVAPNARIAIAELTPQGQSIPLREVVLWNSTPLIIDIDNVAPSTTLGIALWGTRGRASAA